ncbi:NAD(+) synthase [Deltaproteobacteria bacterium Smac51]|nr:NAD(+) synthase [Deltaproteobacteria bacterium Smac51]
MRIALLQGRVRSDRPTDNLEFIKAALNSKELHGVELAVFPQLCLSGRLGRSALERPGVEIQYEKAWEDLLELSTAKGGIALASTRIRFHEDGQVTEEAFVVKGGKVMYKKSRPSDDDEDWPHLLLGGLKIRLVPGRKTLPPQAMNGVDVVISFRTRLFQGAPFMPPAPGPAACWRLNVSAVGGDGPFIYDGATCVFDPAGELKGWANGFDNTTIILDTNSSSLPTIKPLPVREPIEVLYNALKTGLRDYIRVNSSGKVVLGLSGGMDSALVAALAVDALGAENVLGVAMPSEYNAPESLNLARELAKKLSIKFMTIPIDGVREAFTRSFMLVPKGDEKEGNLADENIQARIRGVLLMYISNREDRFVLATGNKSEAAMGYATLYGDTCGAIAPIGDVYKTRVYELAEYINREKEVIPAGIITRPPSAELRPDQKDEDSLPPYDLLDDILHRHLEGKQSGSRVAKEGGHSAITVAWVLSSYKKAAFKRAQMPFALVASTKPLSGLDWV